MTCFQAGRFALTFGPVLLVAACASWCGSSGTAQDLADRLQTRLAPDIAAGRVALDRLPDGTRVTMREPIVVPSGAMALNDTGRMVLTHVIEGLVDPSLVQIEIADSPATPTVTQYFDDYGLGQTLQPAAPQQVGPPGSGPAASQGLTITVRVIAS
jgi:hypothetical protein